MQSLATLDVTICLSSLVIVWIAIIGATVKRHGY